MSAGQQAADEVKGVFKGINQIGEETRKNVNSFADELGGNKTHQSTGFSKDAQVLGHEAGKGVETTSAKADTQTAHTKRTNA